MKRSVDFDVEESGVRVDVVVLALLLVVLLIVRVWVCDDGELG